MCPHDKQHGYDKIGGRRPKSPLYKKRNKARARLRRAAAAQNNTK